MMEVARRLMLTRGCSRDFGAGPRGCGWNRSSKLKTENADPAFYYF